MKEVIVPMIRIINTYIVNGNNNHFGSPKGPNKWVIISLIIFVIMFSGLGTAGCLELDLVEKGYETVFKIIEMSSSY